MKRLISFLVVFCLSFSVLAQSKGNPNKYSSTLGNSACRFFDGFADNGDGTLSDPRSGLIWKRCPEGFNWIGSKCSGDVASSDWIGAMRAAKDSRFLGRSDWRLPSKDEFISILGTPRSDGGEDNCAANKSHRGQYAASKMIAFNLNGDSEPDTFPGVFWSFSPLIVKGSRTGVFAGYFGLGDVAFVTLNSNLGVRLVRGGFSTEESKNFQREFTKYIGPIIEEKRQEELQRSYENSPAGRAEARRAQQSRQICEAQKATCIASCPLDRVFTSLPDSMCKSRCESVSCS